MNGRRKFQNSTYDDLKQVVIDSEETVYSVETLAKELNTTVDAIRKRINRGLIPAHKNGRMWFILKSEYVRSLREK